MYLKQVFLVRLEQQRINIILKEKSNKMKEY